MRILIMGCGRVGAGLATQLIDEEIGRAHV